MINNLSKIFVLFFLLLGIANPCAASGRTQGLSELTKLTNSITRHRPIISDALFRKTGTVNLLPVIIQLKDDADVNTIIKSAITRRSDRFISKKDIKKLQSRLEVLFSSQEKGRDIKLGHKLINLPWVAARVNQRALKKLSESTNVAAIVEDKPVRGLLMQSGSLMNTPQVVASGNTGKGSVVAVLDTGIDTDHFYLAADLVAEACFLSNNGCPVADNLASGVAEDGNGHGTHIAGIITSSHPDFTGISPYAGIVAVKVLDDSANGYFSDIIAGIDWVVENKDIYGINIINLSLGGADIYSTNCDNVQSELPIATSLKIANEAGITVFAASGNEGSYSGMLSPACLSSTISVGSVYDANLGSVSWGSGFCTDTPTSADKVVCSSNVSPELDLLAPGALIDSTNIGGGVANKGGTSMATAHASGVAALLLAKNPALTPIDVIFILKETGVTVVDERISQGFPRIDAAGALASLGDSDNDGYTDAEEFRAKSNSHDVNSQPGSTFFTLSKGYNQVSFPAETMHYDDLMSLMESIGGSSLIDKVQLFNPETQAFYESGYDSFGIFYGDNPLMPINKGLPGLIIYAKRNTTLTFSSKYCQTWDLRTGTNLVGTGCERDFAKLTAHGLLNDLGASAVSVQTFVSNEAVFSTVSYGSAGVPVGKDFTVKPGVGYFINMKQDVTGFRP